MPLALALGCGFEPLLSPEEAYDSAQVERNKQVNEERKHKLARFKKTFELHRAAQPELSDEALQLCLGDRDEKGKGGPHKQVAGQRRNPRSRKMTEAPKKEGWWRIDTHGCVSPPTAQRERYLQVFREMGGSRYIYCFGMVAKCSATSAENAERFARRVKRYPKGIIRDGGLEFEGDFRSWEEKNGILEHQISGRYDPSENGGAESDVREVVLGDSRENVSALT